MTYTRINHLEYLDLDYEHDAIYEDLEIDPDIIDETAATKLVLCGDTSSGVLDDCSYIYVEPNYQEALSVGQRRLYEILVSLQEGSVYTITTLGKLSQMMGLEHPMACGKRLDNLQTLGAITGFKNH